MFPAALNLPLILPLVLPGAPDAASPAGVYVEARTASVFAGACHYNGELVTAGREALCAWSIESGAWNGVDLAGVRIAAVVTSDANLVERDVARRSVVHVDAALAPDQAAAAVRWLAATRADLLGDVVEVRADALSIAIDAATYRVVAPGAFELEGAALPDRACCKMPQHVWYQPLEQLERPLVGLDVTFQVSAPSLDRAWSRPGENAAFLGRFGR